MKEKLIIKNFGPIKSVELDLGRFNVLIGEQATGKSTVAKVLAVCRYFSYIVPIEYPNSGKYEHSLFNQGLDAWGLRSFAAKDSFISYDCLDYSLEVKFNSLKMTHNVVKDIDKEGEPIMGDIEISHLFSQPDLFAKSFVFKNLLSEFEKIKPRYRESNFVIPTSFFLNDVKQVMDNPFYLPTERGLQSIFSIGRASIANLSDSLFNQFARIDQISRLFNNETYIDPLNIYYKNVNGHGFIRKENETKFYSLFNAASGYQSTIPIVLVIKYYNEVRKRKKTFLIEEPELNLFPSAQDELIRYLVDNTINNGNAVLLTTHSPYALTSLNNMMLAYQVGQIDGKKTTELVDEKYWINSEDVSAYLMKSDGTAEDIMDYEVKQIKADRIDEVSREFNRIYDEMLDIKYAANNAG